jgi:hypothetical protein
MIDSIARVVEGSVEKNFALQIGSQPCNPTCTRGAGGFSGMPPLVLGNLQAYRDEVAKLKTWWGERIVFFQQELDKMNIDISKDIIDPEPPKTSATYNPGKLGNGLTVIRNGLKINASDNASIKIFSLTGEMVRKHSLAAGNHAVNLGDLPRGMYMVRTNVDGVNRATRVPIR